MSHTIVIFGASGDLTSRKLIPALYRLHCQDRLPAAAKIVGVSRTRFSHQAFRAALAEDAQKHVAAEFSQAAWDDFAGKIFYQRGDIENADDFGALSQTLHEIERGQDHVRLYYLSTLPRLYAAVIEQLGAAGMAADNGGARRIVIEKPFGVDFATARSLNETLHHVFDEQQVYRIDHYLGKETVQNILVLRLANSIFEPLWNRNYIDHVQITVAEEIDAAGRGAYYDSSGVLRDMFQNHLLQLLMFTAMEPPAQYNAALVRDEKVKVLQSLRPVSAADIAASVVRGQYAGYRQTAGVDPDSQTATFAALRLYVDNWRWQGVPFYLRSGKAMSCRTTQIVIQFREPPHMLFAEGPPRPLDANKLLIQVQPEEGIKLYFQTKRPDAGMRPRTSELSFRFCEEGRALPDAYQRLLLDALLGDASLFARSDEVELAWSVIDPILAAWDGPAAPPLEIYARGQWGPQCSTDWMRQQQREWFDVCPVIK